MKLDRLTVAGVLRFAEPVTLDLTALPAGLVAFVGANGQGKSTLLETPIGALYRTFPSRQHSEVVTFATSRDAFLEAVLSGEAGTYRARVNLDGVKRSSEAVLEHTSPDGTRALLNDGKVSTFDAAIAKVFPPLPVLMASIVASQNKAGSFPALDKRGKKDLFVKLLGLDRYEALAATARQAAQILDAARQGLLAQQEALARSGDPAIDEALAVELGRTLERQAEATVRRAALQQRRDGLRERRGPLEADATTYRAAVARLRDLGAETVAVLERQAAGDRRRAATTSSAEAETRVLTSGLAVRQREIDQRIANNETIVAAGDTILQAATTVAECSESLLAKRELLAARRQEVAAARAGIERARHDLHEANEAVKALERAERAAALLETVPCGGRGDFGGCQFLADARDAEAQIPALRVRAATHGERLDVFAAWCADEQAGLRAVAAIETDVTAIERTRAEAETVATRLPQLENAAARIAELQEERTRVAGETDALVAGVAQRRDAALAELAAQTAGLFDDEARIAAAIREQEAARDRTAHAADALVTVDTELAQLADELEGLAAELARLDVAAADLRRRREAWQAAAAQLAAIGDRRRQVEDDARDWQLLAKAFGRDGLPVLEIDGAGPTVSALTNDLLSVCFGPRFTVELVTQAEKADGKGQKEVFELRVYDNARGGASRELNDLSGGEQVLVDECLKNALALFMAGRHAGAMEFCLRDETTSPLDGENAVRYVEMLRRVQQLGGFTHILMVTHSPMAAAMADVQVRVADGGLTVLYPPFSEAA